MIPKAYITEWRNVVPWQFDYQVEQDLVISRAIVEIFSDDFLREELAFRGGTALNKIYFKLPVRYSEDIDLVQIHPGKIGAVLSRLRDVLNFLGKPRFKKTISNNTLTYRFTTEIEPRVVQKLKIEINTREHYSVKPLQLKSFAINSSWFSGKVSIPTFAIEELLATKLRALYQRRKGRDLFDLWYAVENLDVDFEEIISIFLKYLENENVELNSFFFIENIEKKLVHEEFLGDIKALILPTVDYNAAVAWGTLKRKIENRF